MVPRGTTVNAEYIVGALKMFLKRLRQKRPELIKNGFILHWDNAPVHTAQTVQQFLAKKNIEVLAHPPYSPDLAPADYFLFPRVKADLAGEFLDAETFKTRWDGVVNTITKEQFGEAYQKWVHRHEKCVQLDGDYVEKN